MNLRSIELDHRLTPSEVLRACREFSWPVLLESARYHPERGRYSYFSADPVKTWTLEKVEFGDDPFCEMRDVIQEFKTSRLPQLPPFQGGLIGLLGYELGHCWERLPEVPRDEFCTPALSVGLYDWLICWDHKLNKTWLLVHEDNSLLVGRLGLEQRLAQINSCLVADENEEQEPNLTQADHFGPNKVESSFSEQDYLEAVQKVIEYIRAGDIYQANLSRKLQYPYQGTSRQLYEAVRHSNPAPFAAYFEPSKEWAMISASPEQFLQVEHKHVVTRPIKGTRPRWKAKDTDLMQGLALQAAEKDRAENTMIVDLMRNDLSKVCKLGSVQVPRWCELESFERVHHLVSEVTGELNEDVDIWDLLAATFPGGSITGAPKIRAMEIISELEQTARGHYCGSLFAAGFDGSLQSSILIRTLVLKNGYAQCPVGGGIVADSIPENEYTETEHKAAGLLASKFNSPGH